MLPRGYAHCKDSRQDRVLLSLQRPLYVTSLLSYKPPNHTTSLWADRFDRSRDSTEATSWSDAGICRARTRFVSLLHTALLSYFDEDCISLWCSPLLHNLCSTFLR